MTCDLAETSPGGPWYRIGRHPDPWVWPDWSYAGPDGTYGGRFDDPDSSYRVLYAASRPLGAYLETMAWARPDPTVDLDVIAISDPAVHADEPWFVTGRPRGIETTTSGGLATVAVPQVVCWLAR